MKINYHLPNQSYSFDQVDPKEIENLNFLLSNNKGDFVNLGLNKNTSKFQGWNVINQDSLKVFKILDEILPKEMEVDEIDFYSYKASRKFASKFSENVSYTIDEHGNSDHIEQKIKTTDTFYLGPAGGVVYEIKNFDSELDIDLDCKELNDFDEWGRDYNVFKENGILFVEFTKNSGDNDNYKLWFGIKASNFLYNLKKEWVKKEYEYSKQRNSLHKRYVYRLMSISVKESKILFMGSGFSKEDVATQIALLETHKDELEGFDKTVSTDLLDDIDNFSKPMPQDIDTAYKMSVLGIYKFLSRDVMSKKSKGLFAGYPWFSQVWARDELVGLRSLINLGEDSLVKERIIAHLNSIDEETGQLKRLNVEGSWLSFDGIFWLAKRFADFIFSLDKQHKLEKTFSKKEIEQIYDKFNFSFNKIIKTSWDFENELVKVKNGDSWMDTIEVQFPLDIQAQFLEFTSTLATLAAMLGKVEDAKRFLDLENLLRKKIRQTYFRNGTLYAEAFRDRVDSNVFLTYYTYPDLFLSEDWEKIFDVTLMHLRTTWGGIASLSNKDSAFQPNYTGENNASYHNGDSWYWINNVAAIAMNDLNEKKYRRDIAKILSSSTKDILTLGTVGFGSEISSVSAQKAQGCMAQMWSTATYIEMIDKLFGKQ